MLNTLEKYVDIFKSPFWLSSLEKLIFTGFGGQVTAWLV